MGLRTASARRPLAATAMAPALTETNQPQGFEHPINGKPACNAFDNLNTLALATELIKADIPMADQQPQDPVDLFGDDIMQVIKSMESSTAPELLFNDVDIEDHVDIEDNVNIEDHVDIEDHADIEDPADIDDPADIEDQADMNETRTKDLLDEVSKQQKQLEKRLSFLTKHAKKLQAKGLSQHVSQEVAGVFEMGHNAMEKKKTDCRPVYCRKIDENNVYVGNTLRFSTPNNANVPGVTLPPCIVLPNKKRKLLERLCMPPINNLLEDFMKQAPENMDELYTELDPSEQSDSEDAEYMNANITGKDILDRAERLSQQAKISETRSALYSNRVDVNLKRASPDLWSMAGSVGSDYEDREECESPKLKFMTPFVMNVTKAKSDFEISKLKYSKEVPEVAFFKDKGKEDPILLNLGRSSPNSTSNSNTRDVEENENGFEEDENERFIDESESVYEKLGASACSCLKRVRRVGLNSRRSNLKYVNSESSNLANDKGEVETNSKNSEDSVTSVSGSTVENASSKGRGNLNSKDVKSDPSSNSENAEASVSSNLTNAVQSSSSNNVDSVNCDSSNLKSVNHVNKDVNINSEGISEERLRQAEEECNLWRAQIRKKAVLELRKEIAETEISPANAAAHFLCFHSHNKGIGSSVQNHQPNTNQPSPNRQPCHHPHSQSCHHSHTQSSSHHPHSQPSSHHSQPSHHPSPQSNCQPKPQPNPYHQSNSQPNPYHQSNPQPNPYHKPNSQPNPYHSSTQPNHQPNPYHHSNAQPILTTILHDHLSRSRQVNSDVDTKKPIPSTSVRNLCKKFSVASGLQGNNIFRHKNTTPGRYFGSGSIAIASTSAPRGSSPVTLGQFPVDERRELQRVTGHLVAETKMVQDGLDSEATASSSGGESGDEMQPYNNPHQQFLPIHKRAAWKYSTERAAIAARWTWLQAQVSELEYRIRQYSELHRRIRSTKERVQLGGASPPQNEPVSPSAVNGYRGQLPGSTSKSVDSTPDGQCCRTRPLLNFRKRKLLSLNGLHMVSKKAARPANLRCTCSTPENECALCTGRLDPMHPRDVSDYLSTNELLGLLDPSYHPTISMEDDASSSLHMEAMMRTEDFQTRSISRNSHKTIRFPKTERSGKSTASGEHRPSRKSEHRKKNNRLKPSTANALTAKIKNRYRGKKHSRPTSSLDGADEEVESLGIGTSSMGKFDSPSSSPQLSQSVSGFAKRTRADSYDIDNIIIPYSVAASTRVEKLQYKEILTPKWRIADNDFSPKYDPKNNGVVKADEETCSEDEEDVSEEAVIQRHDKCEQDEKKKFLSYLKLPIGYGRSRSSRRTDSRAESSGGNTPDAMSPASHHPSENPSDSPMTTPPATPGPLIEDNTLRKRTISQSKHLPSANIALAAAVQAAVAFAEKDAGNTPELPEVPPYEKRTFPISEETYERMLKSMPEDHKLKTNSRSQDSFNSGSPPTASEAEHDSESTESAFGDEDPNDPEWDIERVKDKYRR